MIQNKIDLQTNKNPSPKHERENHTPIMCKKKPLHKYQELKKKNLLFWNLQKWFEKTLWTKVMTYEKIVGDDNGSAVVKITMSWIGGNLRLSLYLYSKIDRALFCVFTFCRWLLWWLDCFCFDGDWIVMKNESSFSRKDLHGCFCYVVIDERIFADKVANGEEVKQMNS